MVKQKAGAPVDNAAGGGEATVRVDEPGEAPGESSAVTEASPEELQGAIDKLGDAVRAHEGGTGGYDLSEEAHRSAVDRMADLGNSVELDSLSLVADARDFLLDVIKSRPKPWSACSNSEQRDIAAACEQVAEGLVRQIVEIIRSDGKKPVRVLLQKVAMGDEIQITGKVKTYESGEEDEAVMLLHHARGKHVMLTVASVDDYKGGREAHLDPDDPPLPFEGGDHPDNDSDLVEVLPPGLDSDTGWIDVREASADELAAERERQADFAAE